MGLDIYPGFRVTCVVDTAGRLMVAGEDMSKFEVVPCPEEISTVYHGDGILYAVSIKGNVYFKSGWGQLSLFDDFPKFPKHICCYTIRIGFGGKDYVVFIIDSEDRLWVRSYNQRDQEYTNYPDTLQLVPGIPPIKSIDCENEFMIASDFDGVFYSFGRNDDGQLGIGSRDYVSHREGT